MPVYEYECQECGKVSEFKMSVRREGPTRVCVHCGSASLRPLISVPSISTGRSEPPQARCCGQNEACGEQKHCCGHGPD